MIVCDSYFRAFLFFFFKQKTAYEMLRSLVGSEMCIRDRFSTNLMEELFLAQPPTTTTTSSSPFDTSSGGGGTALDISSSTHHHHHHHHGGAADGGASSEVFILPCKPDISSMSGNHNINRHHQHFNPQYQQLPYTDFYPDTVTHPFENNAPDVARQAASLYGAVRKVTDDAVNKVVKAAAQQQHETHIPVAHSVPTSAAQPPQQVTVEEARQRLVTKQGSPTELRMYRRLLLVGKDPLTTTVPDGSFFAGDSKVVKVIPGSITTEMVTVNVLVEKSVPAASNAPAAGIDEGAVSYTHLTLPTKRIVKISEGTMSLTKKQKET
eukprot:TRINITY_DN22677_c0_g1_i1.p1 TRINITY_DN22677_c0_g1~~TRINITY_DN22677_c0_g1_i1.p1  ORF type:complete len:323 (-),score=72.92 TRINITY_DN22677_c0_g1_i1:7-975(-)